jgi:hypothetical protein
MSHTIISLCFSEGNRIRSTTFILDIFHGTEDPLAKGKNKIKLILDNPLVTIDSHDIILFNYHERLI